MHRKLLNLLPLLTKSDRPHEDAGIDTRLEPAGRHVDPIFQHSTRYLSLLASSVDLEEASPVCFWENVVAHVGLLFVVNKAGSSPTHGPAVRCSRLSLSATLKVLELLYMVGTDMLVLRVSTTQSTNCAVLVGCKNFALEPAIAAGRVVDKNRVAPHALMYRLPAALPMFLFLADVLLPRRQGSLQPHWEHHREWLKLNHQACQKNARSNSLLSFDFTVDSCGPLGEIQTTQDVHDS